MKRDNVKEQGFTLIEVIASLILIGIIGLFAGIGIVTVAESYIFTRENMETSQKGQIALARLVKEFTVINSVSTANATSINYTNYKTGSAAPQSHSVSLSGNNLMVDSDILTDNVSSLQLDYYDTYGGTGASPTWIATRKVIKITLSLTGADNIVSGFSSKVRPRNL